MALKCEMIVRRLPEMEITLGRKDLDVSCLRRQRGEDISQV
jgi:hypothetical protein